MNTSIISHYMHVKVISEHMLLCNSGTTICSRQCTYGLCLAVLHLTPTGQSHIPVEKLGHLVALQHPSGP